MKKILMICFIIVITFVYVGCKEEQENQELIEPDVIIPLLKESKYSDVLNQSIEESFETNNYEYSSPIQPYNFDFERFSWLYTILNKYLLSIKKDNDNVICGYLDISIKEKLDQIHISKPDGVSEIWYGINYYVKKYEYTIEYNIINKKEYPIKWYEIDYAQSIIENYKDLFLICTANLYDVKLIDYETNEVHERKILAENTSLFKDIEKKNYFLLSEPLAEYEMYCGSITADSLYSFVTVRSAEYIVLENEIYISFMCGEKIDEPNINDYIIIDDKYYYNLEEIKGVIEGIYG